MAKRKATTLRLKYFAATQAGDWWYVSPGMLVSTAGVKARDGWVVTGWDADADSVWIAYRGKVECYSAAALEMRWVEEPV